MITSIEETIMKIAKERGSEVLIDGYFDADPLAAAERFAMSKEWQATLKLLGHRRGGRVLDLGAGRGISTHAFSRFGFEVVAVEPLQSDYLGRGALAAIKKKTGAEFPVVDAAAEQIPFEDGSFDIVYCRQVLHHIRNLDTALCEIARVLKPNGTFFAAREHVVDSAIGLQEFLEKHPVHQLIGGEGAYRLNDYTSAMSRAGLTVMRILGSYDSCINYYPASLKDIHARCARLLFPYLGFRLSMYCMRPDLLIGKALFRFLKSRASCADSHQGRMNSFLCKKFV